MLKTIAKFLKILNSETEPAQISLAFCFAMVAGLSPLLSLHNVFVLLLVLVLRVNLSAFLLAFVGFSGIATLLDPVFHQIGLGLLTAEALKGLWTGLYDITFWRIARFNNTLVMGSLASALVLFPPLFLLSNRLIRQYRARFLKWVQKSKLMQALRATKLYEAYETLSQLKGDGG
ncbi:MAG: TIGR03546 family protein [Nitrospiria bacterium]